MAEIDKLQREIEQLRGCLHQLVLDKKEDFADNEVAELSARLDELIVAYEKAKRNQPGKQGAALC
ncbi:MAG: aspartyl-phosphate phosphatase Spo0E family protein [Veillonellales bacterium]